MHTISRRQLGAFGVAASLFPATHAAADASAGTKAEPVDEGLFVPINGMEQWITIRGRDRRNPVLLLLHGGPGFPMTFLAPLLAEWERDFTLVVWDQPGGGPTHAKNKAAGEGPLSIERYVVDGLVVAEFARQRLGVQKLVLMGVSWGTLLGVTMIKRRPELFAAYVGTSQVVSGPEGDRLGYELGLKAARERGDAVAVAALEKVGTPPYARFEDFLVRQTYTNPPGLPPSPAEAAAQAAQGRLLAVPPPPDARYIPKGLPPTDFMQTFMATQRQMQPQTALWEARSLGSEFEVPIFVMQGENDLNTPVALAEAWIDGVREPAKAFEIIPGAGHNTIAFAGELLTLLKKHLRPTLRAAASPRT
jgi:pimeloyl-ACP methyl ester carboxylesterase